MCFCYDQLKVIYSMIFKSRCLSSRFSQLNHEKWTKYGISTHSPLIPIMHCLYKTMIIAYDYDTATLAVSTTLNPHRLVLISGTFIFLSNPQIIHVKPKTFSFSPQLQHTDPPFHGRWRLVLPFLEFTQPQRP